MKMRLWHRAFKTLDPHILQWHSRERWENPSWFNGIFLAILGFVLLMDVLVSRLAPSFSFLLVLILLIILNLVFGLLESRRRAGITLILIDILLLAGLMHLASSFSPKLALNISLVYLIFPLPATLMLGLGGALLLSGSILFLVTQHFLVSGTLASNVTFLSLFSLILGALTVFLYFFRSESASRESVKANILSSDLTGREKDILLLLTEGKANKEIARALGISERTVGNQLSSIYQKLDVVTRQEALLKLL